MSVFLFKNTPFEITKYVYAIPYWTSVNLLETLYLLEYTFVASQSFRAKWSYSNGWYITHRNISQKLLLPWTRLFGVCSRQDLSGPELCNIFVPLNLWVGVSIQEQGYYMYVTDSKTAREDFFLLSGGSRRTSKSFKVMNRNARILLVFPFSNLETLEKLHCLRELFSSSITY